MHRYKLVIFDWDGTLMDSVERIVTSMQAAAEAMSIESPSFDQVKQIIGLSLSKAFYVLFPGCTPELEASLRVQYNYQYTELNQTPTPLFEHAIDLLSSLHRENKLLAVATGKGRKGLQRVLHLSSTEKYFHASRCADECRSKPDPDMVTSLLAELKIKPHEAVMIGDTSYDMEMAQRAGVDRIGVTFGVHNEQILSQHSPIAIVNSLLELKQILIKY